MEVSTAERAVKIKENRPKTSEGPKNPGRRRLLKAAGALLAAEIGASAGLAAWPTVEQGLKGLGFLSQPRSVEIPTLNPIEPDKPASEKAINKVPLAELTQKTGRVGIVAYGGKISAETPYAASLFFGDLTIVDVEKNPDNTVWVALAMPGDKLSRQSMGTSLVNFDGSKTDQYSYRGFASWILVDNNILVIKGSNRAFQGLAELESRLKVGDSISFTANLNQLNPGYQKMNLDSFNLLSANIGKPNLDRSDQIFKFAADFAFINLSQK